MNARAAIAGAPSSRVIAPFAPRIAVKPHTPVPDTFLENGRSHAAPPARPPVSVTCRGTPSAASEPAPPFHPGHTPHNSNERATASCGITKKLAAAPASDTRADESAPTADAEPPAKSPETSAAVHALTVESVEESGEPDALRVSSSAACGNSCVEILKVRASARSVPAARARTRSLSVVHETRAETPTPAGDGDAGAERDGDGAADVDAARVCAPRADTVLLSAARPDALDEGETETERLAKRVWDSRADPDVLPLVDGLALDDLHELGDALALALDVATSPSCPRRARRAPLPAATLAHRSSAKARIRKHAQKRGARCQRMSGECEP
jgi:hypothetical protein